MRNIITQTSLSGLFLFCLLPIEITQAHEYLGQFGEKKLQEILYLERSVSVNEKKIPFPLKELVDMETTLFFLNYPPTLSAEIENIEFCPESSLALNSCQLLKTLPEKINVKKKTKLTINKEKANLFLEKIAPDFEKKAVEPTFNFDETSSKLNIKKSGGDGFYLDKEKSLERIFSSLKSNLGQSNITLATTVINPKTSVKNLDSLGIKEKIATGQSNFAGSTQNRIHNIKISTERFNGTIVPPGSEFSFVEILGSVDEKSGYKEELVIKNNETIPEFGGGVCQTSTTLFRSILNAGFKITERKNHAYPVQYYAPQGTDATIYIPHPDLRFINNTSHHILLQPKIEGSLLIFDIYGTNDGRQIKIDGPIVTERKTEAKTMRTSLTQTVTNSSGEVIINQTFRSFYDNPEKYKKEEPLREKPSDWSKREWEKYKKENSL